MTEMPDSSDTEHPVTVTVERDGRVEEVRVGTAVRRGEGFSLRLGELSIGAPITPLRRISSALSGAVFPNYGRRKGEPVAGASEEDLDYYARGCRRTLADPGKARFHDKERTLLAAIEAEMSRRGGAPADDTAPLDDDVPF